MILRDMLRHRWWARLLILAFSLLGAVAGLASPFCQKLFVDILQGQPQATFGPAWTPHWSATEAIAAAFGALLVSQALGNLTLYLGAREAAFYQRRISDRIYLRILSLRADEQGDRPTGEWITYYAVDIQSLSELIQSTLPAGASILFPLVLGPIAVHALFGVPLGSTLAIIGSVVTVNVFLASRQARLFAEFKKLSAVRAGMVSEWIQNIRALRLLDWTSAFESRIFAKREAETLKRIAMVSNGQFMGAFSSSITFALNLAAVGLLIAARASASPSSRPTVTPGEVLALLWIIGIFLFRPFRMLPWIFTFALDAVTSIGRLESFFAEPLRETENLTPPEPAATGPREIATAVPPAISVKNLRLALGNHEVLRGIDFEAAPGEWVALVGEVGSGKSQLLLSILGETPVEYESFTLGGRDVAEMPLTERRASIAYVPQEGFIISTTLRDNVAFSYGTRTDSDLRVEAALRDACFPVSDGGLPAGLDTEIGERGVNLSGGQKQRVGLARAAYHDMPILLLDDCLSAVDVHTEETLIKTLLLGRWAGRTRILVTHRLSVLPYVDRVVFLKKGRVVDQGSYAELTARSEEFRRFATTVARQETENPMPGGGGGFANV